jgi:hypothetical protein
MMIRPLRASDALSIGLLQAGKDAPEITASIWPRTPPESKRDGLASLLRQAIIRSPSEVQTGIDFQAGRTRGLVTLRARASGLAWDIEYLRAVDEHSAAELARWAIDRAITARARRIFLATPDTGEAATIPPRAGFEQYSAGATYRLDPGFSRETEEAIPARPRLRSDEIPLFQLYNAVVPANVRSAEALTQEEWAALYPGRKPWAPRMLGDRQDYVWEIGPRLAGWMRVIFGARAQSLELLVDPSYESHLPRMLRYALVQMSAKAPVLVDVREYQGAVQAALEQVGFRRMDSYFLWVLQLANRVPESKWAPVTPTALR